MKNKNMDLMKEQQQQHKVQTHAIFSSYKQQLTKDDLLSKSRLTSSSDKTRGKRNKRVLITMKQMKTTQKLGKKKKNKTEI